jgi:hypothetical protein
MKLLKRYKRRSLDEILDLFAQKAAGVYLNVHDHGFKCKKARMSLKSAV